MPSRGGVLGVEVCDSMDGLLREQRGGGIYFVGEGDGVTGGEVTAHAMEMVSLN